MEIDIKISGQLPAINDDLTNAMKQIEELMVASVQLNLMMGGRPEPFHLKHPNETPLVGTGKMYRGIKGMSDQYSASVYMDSSVVSEKGFFYPAALNFGADIPPFGTPKEERFNTPLNMLGKGKGVPINASASRKALTKQGLKGFAGVKVMVFEIDGHTVFTTTRKGFHLGAFPFMILQEQDEPRILETLSNAIIRQNGEIIQ